MGCLIGKQRQILQQRYLLLYIFFSVVGVQLEIFSCLAIYSVAIPWVFLSTASAK